MIMIDPILKQFIQDDCPASMSYSEYMELMTEVHSKNKTTGLHQSEDYVHYSKLNEQRMKRLNKTVVIIDSLVEMTRQIRTPQLWLVITEAWCGDAAQNIPVMVKLAELNPLIELRIILRDDNPEIMNLYLTNGGKSIPKLIAINDQFEELFHWGPRPSEVQKMVIDYRNLPEPRPPYSEFSVKVQQWYNQNKTQAFQDEILTSINIGN